MNWQKRTRLGVAVFGIAFGGVVYFKMGTRAPVINTPPPVRVDPKALVETARGSLNRVTGTRQDFVVNFEHSLGYENGESKFAGVRIEVKERQGRDFLITAAEALANEKSRDIKLSGNVELQASDGFQLSTATATFNENDGIVRTPAAVTFKKGTMSGTGMGMTYDKNTDVLTIAEQAHVVMVDEAKNSTGEFTAGTATFARQQDYLSLERTVHALRGEQTIDAERAVAHLTENDETMTSIELRGSARVAGGSTAFDSMSARDIDIDYADDGTTIERVILNGSGAIALKGTDGAPGRQMLGESLNIALAPDGSLLSAVGRDNTQLDLPASEGNAARHVRAKSLDAAGEPGKGLTSAQFTDDVEYREEAAEGAAPRTARSQRLQVALDGNALNSAIFTGKVEFEEKGLKAGAAEAAYDPAKGGLQLKGVDEGGGPRVSDERITIEADAIDVTLEGRKMVASNNVKTRLQGGAKTPGLLKKEEPANVSATNLRYEGDAGLAVYTGTAQLWQGDTAIRGDTIAIDQEKGNLTASGAARSTLALGEETSVGRADQIRYDDASRQIVFLGAEPLVTVSKTPPPATTGPLSGTKPAAPAALPPAATASPRPAPPAAAPGSAAATGPLATAPAAAAAPAPSTLAQLSGPEGDLRANRIVVFLVKDEARMERLEAYDNVSMRVDQRTATSARLTYLAGEGRYTMVGAGTVPVTLAEACRQTTGRTLTFFKSTDRIIVDGNEEIRTRSTSGGPCPQLPQ
jgi:LPS export ABC transporter protein LptC